MAITFACVGGMQSTFEEVLWDYNPHHVLSGSEMDDGIMMERLNQHHDHLCNEDVVARQSCEQYTKHMSCVYMEFFRNSIDKCQIYAIHIT